MSWIDRMAEADANPEIIVTRDDFAALARAEDVLVEEHRDGGYRTSGIFRLLTLRLPRSYAGGSGIVEYQGQHYWCCPSGRDRPLLRLGGPWEGKVNFPYRHRYID